MSQTGRRIEINECLTITNSFRNTICFQVLDDSDSLEIDENDSIENIQIEDLSNKKRVMDEIRKPRKRQRTFRRKSGSSLERVDSGVRVKSVRPNDFTRLQDTDLPLPNQNKVVIKYDDYELDFREVKIPYDVIIGRNSIIRYNLLRYDNDFARVIRWRTKCTQSMRPYEKNLVKGNPTRVQPNHEHIVALDEPMLAGRDEYRPV